jgi:Spy/CpxP family protein refolding chaperone
MGPGPGAWWKDSETVKKLGLSEAQVGQIEQIFLAHRLRLVDLRADLEKQEIGLQPLLDVERPDEAKVSTQIDLITAARGRLGKEHVSMLLAIRRELSVEQWKRLQALQLHSIPGVHSHALQRGRLLRACAGKACRSPRASARRGRSLSGIGKVLSGDM